jgi:hypothetical protein
MTRDTRLSHEFVDYIPDKLQPGKLYLSIEYATAAHRCCCGCGNDVITPITPTDWRVTFDGETVSLEPSIGNWNFDCQSHYWIVRNRVKWAPRWSRAKVDAGRARDRAEKERYFDDRAAATTDPVDQVDRQAEPRGGFGRRLAKWLSRR